ncbi:MAG: 50S ribosomal protein L3 [Candidatus Sifarchaeia archaeon]|jgi:large subunit ribosomal protein L3
MGHRKRHAPKRGSLAYLPRGRSAHPVGKIKTWPSWIGPPTLLGFAGYKAGMTHVVLIEDYPHSPFYGQERVMAVTVLDTPPLFVCGMRTYESTPYGLSVIGESWFSDLNSDLSRVFPLPKDYNTSETLNKLKDSIETTTEVRAIVHTQPILSGVTRRKPHLFEVKIGGGETIQEQFDYANAILGKETRVTDILKGGQIVDTSSISIGKGFQGPVKRWGIRILQHKSRGTKRGVGAIGPWKPHHMFYTVPRAGQLGYHQRTDYNKRILKIGEDGDEITPPGGFIRYGIIRGDYMILQGSITGHRKNLIKMRYALRAPLNTPSEAPTLSYIRR